MTPMTVATAAPGSHRGSRLSPDSLLQVSGAFWFTVALTGPWLFAYYIAVFYGSRSIAGDWKGWSDRMIKGFIEGDGFGNATVFMHIVLAFVVTVAGPLQFIPAVRRRAPAFHRWNGRAYAVTGVLISLGALYMVWTRGALDGRIGGFNSIGISINAALIITFAALSVQAAMARRMDSHRRWALRLFLSMSGVWFMRVGYGLWSFLHQGGRPPGVNGQLNGWFDSALPFLVVLIPLTALEIYLRARDSSSPTFKVAAAVFVCVLTVLMACGIYRFGGRLVPMVT
jgi:hypothetical protein